MITTPPVAIVPIGTAEKSSKSAAAGPSSSRPLADDGEFRADAFESFLNSHSRRGEAIHATVAVFRRHPNLRVFYVDNPGGMFEKPGWYSYEQHPSNGTNGHPPPVRGPFASHLDARNAWLRR